MTFRDSLLPKLAAARAIPGGLGLRPYSVTVQVTTTTLDNDAVDDTVAQTPLLEGDNNPKVRITGGGRYGNDRSAAYTATVGPITPSHTGGGYTLAQIAPDEAGSLTDEQVCLYIITGPLFPSGKAFELVEVKRHDRGFHYMLELRETTEE